MQRDFGLIRSILLKIEESETRIPRSNILVDGYTKQQVQLHYALLEEEGFLVDGVVGMGEGSASVQFDTGTRLTMKGYDFLDTLRDPDIWAKTKAGAKAVGGVTLDFFLEIGKSYLKSYIQQKIGITLG